MAFTRKEDIARAGLAYYCGGESGVIELFCTPVGDGGDYGYDEVWFETWWKINGAQVVSVSDHAVLWLTYHVVASRAK